MKATVLSIALLICLAVMVLMQLQTCSVKKENNTLQTAYDALYEAKTKSDTITVRDTTWLKQDTAFLAKIITKEVPVTDSFYIDQPLMDRTYENTLTANNVEIKYKAIVRGWLLDLELSPIVETKYIHTQNIVTEIVPTWGSGFSIGGGGIIPRGYYASVGYRVNRITYRGAFIRIQDQNMGMIGAEFNF
jgi:hypothetical protein